MIMDFITAAFDLCAFGWVVFPLAPFSKIPAIPQSKGGRGCLDATDDEEIIADWAYHLPNANIGVACGEPSGVLVIDFDPRNGSEETVKRFAEKKKTFPPTVEVQTWSGGTHLYYRWEPEIKNSKSKLGPGIDVKTTGGYVVAPPSRVKHGGASGQYTWVRSPLGAELPRLPRWAVDVLKPKPEPIIPGQKISGSGDLGALFRYISVAPKGERNNVLHWAACRAAEKGATDSGTRDELIASAQRVGLPKIEAEKTVASAFRKVGRV